MRKMIVLAALGLGVLGAGSALAFPAPQPPQAATSAAAPDGAPVEHVAQGCGLGFHRGPWGGCRPNGVVVVPGPVVVAPGPVVVAPAPVVVVPATRCWWRSGPYGAVRVCN